MRGSSLLQVRRGSRLGRLIFQGTLERGRSLPFVGQRLWLYAGSPENLALRLNGRSVVYDTERRELHMYYGANLPDPSAPTATRYKVCLALSQDGLHWRRPNLGLVEWEGSRSNNILPWGENWMRRPNVILDPRDPDPNRRYKMTYVDVIGGLTAITKGYSADGIHWVKLRANPILELGGPGSFDENGLGEPAVWSAAGFYWMLYTGRGAGEV